MKITSGDTYCAIPFILPNNLYIAIELFYSGAQVYVIINFNYTHDTELSVWKQKRKTGQP